MSNFAFSWIKNKNVIVVSTIYWIMLDQLKYEFGMIIKMQKIKPYFLNNVF